MAVKMTVLDNGPIKVEGEIEIFDANGAPIQTKATSFLCRCGASTKKPFCDGQHSKVGFAAAAEAVPESAE